MLTVNNIGLLQYKTLKVATLNSITQIIFHTPGVPTECSLKVTGSQWLFKCQRHGTQKRNH